MRMRNTILSLSALAAVIFSLMSCGMSESSYNEKIKEAELALQADSTSLPPKEEVVKLIDMYSDFATRFPESEITPEYLFRAGRYCMSYQLSTKAVEFFDKIITTYPNYPQHADSYFLKAFVYDSQLSNIPKARQTYEELIEKYPSHELSEQARQLIGLLGKSLEEIVAGFEQNNNDTLSETAVK